MLTLLITVPLTLHYLGVERYGMWGTMSSFIALLSFADFGIGNGLLTRVSAAHGRGDQAEIIRYISSAFFVLSLIAMVLGIAFSSIYNFVPWHRVFNVQGALARQEAGPAIAVLAACIALNLPLAIVQKVQVGLQQGFLAYLWTGLASVAGLIAVLAAIHFRAGLPWLVMAFVGIPTTVSLINSVTYFATRQDIRPQIGSVSKHGITTLTQTGLLFVILQMVVAAGYGSDNIIVAHTLGAAHVAEYSVPAQLFTLITTVLGVALAPLWPAYGAAIGQHDTEWVKATLIRSLTTAIAFASIASLALLLAAPTILRFWVGHTVHAPFLLLLGLSLWRVIDAGGSAVTVYLNGANLLRFQLSVLGVAGVLAVVFKVMLIHAIGISGVAWGSILSYLLAAIPTIVFLRRKFT